MRQSKKEIFDRGVIEGMLRQSLVGRLGTKGGDGYPRVIPLNFVYDEGRIYFHSAREGEKIDDILRDNRVCFETDLPIAFVKGAPDNPCRAEYLYRSVMIFGTAHLVADEGERRRALLQLMKKYQPEGGYGDFLPDKLARTAVVRIDPERITGKEDLGTGAIQEAARAALAAGAALPVVLEQGKDLS